MAKNPHFFSQLAYITLLSTHLDETLRFYTEIVGLDLTRRDEDTAYLRAWGDYFHHSLKIKQSDKKGLGGLGWRADSEEALHECVDFLEKSGAGLGWVEADLGRGRAYKFQSPDGHVHEVFWDVIWLKEFDILGSGTVGWGSLIENNFTVHRPLEPGDVVELEIKGIGVLKNKVI